MFIALICAVLFFANIVLRTWLLPSVGLALLVLSSILLGLVWPGIVQQFQVEPSQADKEQQYIKKNIDATRAAYDLEDSVVTPYSGTSTLTSDQQAEEIKNVPGIRLVDPALIKATFEQRQQVTRYYSVVREPGRRPLHDQRRSTATSWSRPASSTRTACPTTARTGPTCTPSTPTGTA